ncbi:MAG: sulfatase-like hydrolase/transferase, partial [Lentisphaeria bacterium]|nr:sulfatase-like hydrolase/transferase [Lentisphaeria bacterium]
MRTLPGLLATALLAGVAQAAPRPPNIVVILADDLGYADLGCQGSEEVRSPRIDSIAANGVRCTAGYVTAPQCCPSRAGLVSGRYQNRFGFEANWPASLGGEAGLPPGVTTIGDHLKAAGYVTGMVGKWHLGDAESMRPCNRGFDETLWHPNGGVLFPDPKTGFLRSLYRNGEPVQVAEYSTDAFGREAAEFIARHAREPFFLYLAFVPPHWPMEAKPEHLDQYAHVPDLHRRTMLAMMASLDENVGRVLDALRRERIEEDTLLFFLSDNGGPTGRPRSAPDAPFDYGQNTSRNDPCRGVKGDLLEGGIRVPFLVQWKGHLPAGKTYDRPVISLDILPTALAAAGVAAPADADLDGTDLLPYLRGEAPGAPHHAIFWRFRFPPAQPERHRWAIRQGDWKLVRNDREPLALYHLATDIGETTNLAAQHPERLQALQAAYRAWDAANREPLWTDPPPVVRGTHHATATAYPTEIRLECTGNDPQAVFGDIPPATGPYRLEMRLKSASSGPGEIFWVTTPTPAFRADQRLGFTPTHDPEQWQSFALTIPVVSPPLTFLRLDPGNAPGWVRIADLVLRDGNGNVVKAWIGKPRAATETPAIKAGTETRADTGAPSPGQGGAADARPLLLACYYVWYETGAHPRRPWSNWTRPECEANAAARAAQRPGEPPVASAAYPLAGLYSSSDPDVAEWHVQLARAAGIDAFLVSWWDDHMERDKAWEEGIFRAAERRGFRVALLDERAQFHSDFAWYKDRLVKALARFQDSPAYLRIDGRPVVYLYQVAGQATLTPAKFAELKAHVESARGPVYWIVDKLAHDHAAAQAGRKDEVKCIPADWLATPGIDTFAFYSTFSHFRAHRYEELAGTYRYLTRLAHDAGKRMLLPVHPGHDNSRFRDDPYIMPRRDGQTLRDYLRAATDAGAEMLMVTSWNEWPETTVVEPSSTWPDPYL